MRYIISLIIIIVISLLQATVLNYISIFSIKPDLFLIYAIFSLFYLPKKIAVFSCIASAIFKDIFSITAFGINTLFFSLWSIIILRLSKKIYQDNAAFRTTAIFIIGLTNSVFFYCLYLFNTEWSFVTLTRFLFRISLLEAAYTALVSILLFKVFKQCASKYFTY